MEVKIKTLTPIWTGDVDRKCSKIRETGIIGSLRWWYEALVRGFGGYACDPTSERRCELDQRRLQNAIREGKSIQEALDEQICPACQLFGCTGWSRRFRVEMEDLPLVNLKFVTKIDHPSFKTDLRWWINKTLGKNPVGFYGETKLKVVSPYNKEIEDIIAFLLKTISLTGGLGAKTQNGFGIFTVKNLKKEQIRQGYELFQRSLSKSGFQQELPNFNNFFKIDVKVDEVDTFREKLLNDAGKTSNYILSGFAIKFLLRAEFKNLKNLPVTNFIEIKNACNEVVRKLDGIIKELDNKINKLNQIIKEETDNKKRKKLEEKKKRLQENRKEYELLKRKYKPSKVVARYLFGSDLEEKWASRINVSHAYSIGSDLHFRIWGEIPPVLSYDRNITVKFDKKKVIGQIIKILESCFGFNTLEFGTVKFKDQLLKEVLG